MLDGALGVVSANPCGYEVDHRPCPQLAVCRGNREHAVQNHRAHGHAESAT